MKFIPLLIATITLSGCIGIPLPYPHKVTELPETRGQVVDAEGTPVSELSLRLSKFRTATSARGNVANVDRELLEEEVTKTNDSGEFIFKEKHHWQFFKMLWILGPIDPIYDYSEMSLTVESNLGDKEYFENEKVSPYFVYRKEYNPWNMWSGGGSSRYGPYDLDKLVLKNPNQKLEPTCITPVD